MSQNVREFLDKYKRDMGKLQKLAPDAIAGFGALHGAVMKDGAVSLKNKELMAVAIGLALRCEPCILLHVKKCLSAGATREEILDAASVAVMMQGGPSYTYLPVVLDALEAASEKGPSAG